MNFTGKNVIVTGSSCGFGRAFAIEFARHGANVLIHGRNEDSINVTVEECVKVKHPAAKFPTVCGNIEDDVTLERIVKTAVEELGGIDVLINNAGGATVESLLKSDIKLMDTSYQVFLRAPIYLSQLCFPELKKSHGNILNISGILGARPSTILPFYIINKAGLNMFTQCAALEYGPENVRVNAFYPGYVPTEFMPRMFNGNPEACEAIRLMFEKATPIGRLGTLEQTAKVVAFLVSDDASMFNGSIIGQDGGVTLTGLDAATLQNGLK